MSLQLLPKEQRKVQWDDFNDKGCPKRKFMPAGTPDKACVREKCNIIEKVYLVFLIEFELLFRQPLLLKFDDHVVIRWGCVVIKRIQEIAE